MLESALKVLSQIEEYGYKAYIVGGFVRDYLLGKKSPDVDITTNATPKDLKYIFPNSFLPNEAYGAITIISDKIRFEITTFRKEISYSNNRKPLEFEYIDNLKEDLLRRDFTINTFCIDSSGKIIDLLNVMNDLDNKIICTVHNEMDSFTEDALRILRAIRFATVLDFKLSQSVKDAIKKCKKYLKIISYKRKKDELDKIFMSSNASYGVSLIRELGLDVELEIYNINDIKLSSDLVGIWASLEVSEKYPFTRVEKELISKIKYVSKLNKFDNYTLYKYGPYVNGVAAYNTYGNKNEIISKYNNLPIKTRSDILISSKEIIELFNIPAGKYIGEILSDVESKILSGQLNNDNVELKNYIKNKYIIQGE